MLLNTYLKGRVTEQEGETEIFDTPNGYNDWGLKPGAKNSISVCHVLAEAQVPGPFSFINLLPGIWIGNRAATI